VITGCDEVTWPRTGVISMNWIPRAPNGGFSSAHRHTMPVTMAVHSSQ